MSELNELLTHLSNGSWDVIAHVFLGIVYLIYVILSYFKDKEVKRWITENRYQIISLEKRLAKVDNIKDKEVIKIDTGLKTTLGFGGYFLYFLLTLCYLFIAYKVYVEVSHFGHLLKKSQ